MKVLLLGGGGREHALGWKLAQSPRVSELISAPGNPGLASLGETVPGLSITDGPGIREFAVRRAVDLVVIGPEAPLAAGVVDALGDLAVWGPSRSAAALESSKTFAKQIMERAGVRTAQWASFSEAQPARQYLDRSAPPYVVKANGLAAGKGVLVTTDLNAAKAWVERCLQGEFGERRVLIEEYLGGPEVSVFAMCAGEDAIALEPARDFKRLLDGDRGPNTGGMGSFSPVADLPPGVVEETLVAVVKPVLRTLAADGNPYTGFLYIGLVLTENGPTVLEFNCRLGDPETQVVLPRLESDLVDLIEAGLEQRLSEVKLTWSDQACLNVVLAAPGYPDAPVAGGRISIGELGGDTLLFHAGTELDEHGLVATGGRVLNVVGIGADLDSARAGAYGAVRQIRYEGAQYRRDI